MSAMESPKAARNSQGWRVVNTVGFLFKFLREMGHFAFLSERNIFANSKYFIDQACFVKKAE